MAFQRQFSKKQRIPFLHKDKLLRAYQNLLHKGMIAPSPKILRILQTKNVRSSSGLVVVSVLTKPFPCPGECIFCPTESGIPKSYLSGEPAVMRAVANKFDPYRQVNSRLTALSDTGHNVDKVSIRIIGGTWSSYSKKYRSWFVRRLFQACNEFLAQSSADKSLIGLQKNNEVALARIVELSVETRQDAINRDELKYFRHLGITKVELGVQTLDDNIARINKRSTALSQTIGATKLLKDFGFKVSYQMMLNLYGSTPEQDREIFQTMFEDQRFRPDHLKIYPLALLKNTSLYAHYKKGDFKPYDQETLVSLIADIKSKVPNYCRIERVIRDIPANLIVSGGAAISNLRQAVESEMTKRGERCACIRCREIKSHTPSNPIAIIIDDYEASDGQEYFISAVETSSNRLLGFCRLRIPTSPAPRILRNTAIIREIHVYGPVVAIGEKSSSAVQHLGWGKKLLAEAENITQKHRLPKIAVIAGVGVRGYFRKLGYELESTYMIKQLP